MTEQTRRIDHDILRRCLEVLNMGGCVDQDVIDAIFAEPERPEPPAQRCQWYGHDGEGPQCQKAATTKLTSRMFPEGRPLCEEHAKRAVPLAGPERPAEPGIDEAVKPAPAADPRRLTDSEVADAIATARKDYTYRAIADAQLAKARVTISEVELREWWRGGGPPLVDLYDMLRSKGVEVVP